MSMSLPRCHLIPGCGSIERYHKSPVGLPFVFVYAGETLLNEAVQMSLRVGLVQPNDHIVVVQMISDALVVKVCTRILMHLIYTP